MRWWLGLVLSAVAGFVDAVGWIAFGGVFVAFMSGNTTRLGVEAVRGDGVAAWQAAQPVLAFVAGAVAGAWARRAGGLAGLLAAEAALLAMAAAMVAASGAAVLPLALAMGMQNLARQAAGPAQLGGTFITGTLVGLAQALAAGEWRGAGAQAAAWLALLAGILAGALAMGAGAAPALAGVALLLLVLAGTAALLRG
ncbi:DUF1275 family protein [Falsiroseomonas ponticola]|jgi:oxalate decarboxylase|uniref:DUF1275 family protein n=1 Tax=Falsiroseomonas ponticola TaxID=2786951 RepID=UPI0019339968|nr:DUF1275 family protein [Roseomonas ponticola]